MTLMNDLQQAVTELRQLREELRVLRAKDEVLQIFAAALFASTQQASKAVSPDVVWALQRRIDETKENVGKRAGADAE